MIQYTLRAINVLASVVIPLRVKCSELESEEARVQSPPLPLGSDVILRADQSPLSLIICKIDNTSTASED